MIRSLITTKTLFYRANANENSFSASSSTENFLNSRTLGDSCACAKERKHAVHMSTKSDDQVFNTVHHKRQRFHALLKYFTLKHMVNKGNNCSDIEAITGVLITAVDLHGVVLIQIVYNSHWQVGECLFLTLTIW